MLLKHFFVKKIAHSSYMLAGQKSCAVIDPQRDIDIYPDSTSNKFCHHFHPGGVMVVVERA